MDIISQVNAVLYSNKTEVMAKITQLTAAMGEIQDQIKIRTRAQNLKGNTTDGYTIVT